MGATASVIVVVTRPPVRCLQLLLSATCSLRRMQDTPGGLIVHSHARSSRQVPVCARFHGEADGSFAVAVSVVTHHEWSVNHNSSALLSPPTEILSSQSPSGSSDRIGRMLQLLVRWAGWREQGHNTHGRTRRSASSDRLKFLPGLLMMILCLLHFLLTYFCFLPTLHPSTTPPYH